MKEVKITPCLAYAFGLENKAKSTWANVTATVTVTNTEHTFFHLSLGGEYYTILYKIYENKSKTKWFGHDSIPTKNWRLNPRLLTSKPPVLQNYTFYDRDSFSPPLIPIYLSNKITSVSPHHLQPTLIETTLPIILYNEECPCEKFGADRMSLKCVIFLGRSLKVIVTKLTAPLFIIYPKEMKSVCQRDSHIYSQ